MIFEARTEKNPPEELFMRTELSVVLTAYIFEAFERLLSFKTGHTEAHAPHLVQSEKSTCG